MPSIRDKSTIKALARAFIDNGRHKIKAMITVGYTPAYADSYCGAMWGNMELIKEIDRIDAETEEKADMSRDALVKSQMAIVNTGTNSEKTRAASLVADMMGYMGALGKFKKGDKAKVIVLRGDEEIEVEVEF